jgi:hypothetical protein
MWKVSGSGDRWFRNHLSKSGERREIQGKKEILKIKGPMHLGGTPLHSYGIIRYLITSEREYVKGGLPKLRIHGVIST